MRQGSTYQIAELILLLQKTRGGGLGRCPLFLFEKGAQTASQRKKQAQSECIITFDRDSFLRYETLDSFSRQMNRHSGSDPGFARDIERAFIQLDEPRGVGEPHASFSPGGPC